MTEVLKFVSNVVASNSDPLGILNDPEHYDLMVGTFCAVPDTIGSTGFNWHFRLEGVTASDIYPRQLDGPTGTWYNPSLDSTKYDDKCNSIENWPMHVIQTLEPDSSYSWDIYVAPYLGGSYISGVAPMLPIPGTEFSLQIFQGNGTTAIDTIVSEPIPDLFPVFGEARNGKSDEDFYPAKFGYAYSSGGHEGADIVPLGLFASGTPSVDWDTSSGNNDYKTIYAVTDGQVLLDTIEPGVVDIYLRADTSGPYSGLDFGYIHVVPSVSHNDTVTAGDPIGTIINYAVDGDRTGGQTHLHFEVTVISSNTIKDPRQFIYPGLTPNP